MTKNSMFPIERKGVNIKEFLATRKDLFTTKIIKQEEPVIQEVIEKKAILLDPFILRIKKKRQNSLFKFMDADRIVRKDILFSFIKWFSVPREIRNPKTQKEFAEVYKIDMDTLSNWKNLTGFYEEVELHNFNEIRTFMSEIGWQIIKSARKGDTLAQGLFLQLYMRWEQKSKAEAKRNENETGYDN